MIINVTIIIEPHTITGNVSSYSSITIYLNNCNTTLNSIASQLLLVKQTQLSLQLQE